MAWTVFEATVDRLHSKGDGFTVVEEHEHRGETKKTYWGVFPQRDKPVAHLMVGNRVRVSGFLSTKVTRSERGEFVDHTLSGARVEVLASEVQSVAPVADVTADVSWPVYDESTPF